MTRGALLFAFNSPNYNYVEMAEFTAKRINRFLNIPVTLVTDQDSIKSNINYNFDHVRIVNSDPTNYFQNKIWINKGRYQAYELSPYDETLLLDVDYVINSDRLLKAFDTMDDFNCHKSVSYLMSEYNKQEYLSHYKHSLPTLWATVVTFKKTKRVKHIFECLKMVQENYQHYTNLYKFENETFRNDYGLTIAYRTVNGHEFLKSDIIPWNLLHIGLKTKVYKNSSDLYNTDYTIIYDKWIRNKIKKEYITISNTDFHVINKDIMMELIK